MIQKTFGRKTRPTRKKQEQEAWIAVGGSFATRHCTVLDMSEGGVKLRLDDPQFVSSPFELKFSRTAKGRPCKIAWQKGREIGAAFL